MASYNDFASKLEKIKSAEGHFENNKGWMKINKNTEVITQIQKMLEYDKLS